jgi:PST family polysaccharide transporter
MVENISQQTFRGLRWKTRTTIVQVALQFGTVVLLARILPPSDFGTLSYAMVFVGFSGLVTELGIGPAIVQRSKLSNIHLRVGFTLSLITGTFGTTVLYFLAPRLVSSPTNYVLQAVAFSFLISSAGTVAGGLLIRRLDFRTDFWVSFLSVLFGFVLTTVILALLGFGVWSLVVGTLVQAMVRTTLLIFFSPHSYLPSLSLTEIKDLLKFGSGMTLARTSNYVARNGDYFIIGHIIGLEGLGLYSRAYQLALLPSKYFQSILSAVLFATYSRVQDDKAKLHHGYLLSITATSLYTFPLMIVLAIVAPEVMRGILGPAWIDAAPSFRILSLAGIATPIYSLADSLVRARGQVYSQFARHTIYAALVLLGSLIGSRYGVEGVAICVVGAILLMGLMMTKLALRICGANWKDILLAHRAASLVGGIVGVVCWSTVELSRQLQLPDLLILAMATIISITTALLVLFQLPSEWLREIPKVALQEIQKALPKRLGNVFLKRSVPNRRLGLQ